MAKNHRPWGVLLHKLAVPEPKLIVGGRVVPGTSRVPPDTHAASQCDIASAMPLLYRAKRAVIVGEPQAPKGRFELAWEPKAANGRKKGPGERFLLWGTPQSYLDQVLVWKSDLNTSLANCEIKIADTGEVFVFGVEIEPNKVAIPA